MKCNSHFHHSEQLPVICFHSESCRALWLHRMWIFSVSSFSILQDSVSENRHSSVFLLLVYHFLFPLWPHHNFIFYYCFGLMKMQFYNINLWKAEIVKTIKKTWKLFCQIFWWKQRVLLLYSGSQHTWIISRQEKVSQFLSRLLRWIPEQSPNDFSRTLRLQLSCIRDQAMNHPWGHHKGSA